VLVARTLDDKKGQDTVVLDVAGVLGVCDAFVISSAPNTRLVRTLADEVEKAVKLAGGSGPLRVEGLRDLTWVLLDYGDVVVHVFLDETRRFYDIERLYRDCPKLEWQPEGSTSAGTVTAPPGP
jgi:ribosome-associated protein